MFVYITFLSPAPTLHATARWDGQPARPTVALAWALPERGRELVMVIVVAMAMVVTMMVVATVLMVVVVVVLE